MYSRYSMETALLNPKRNVKEILVEKKFEHFFKNFLIKNNIHEKKIKFKVTNKSEIFKKIGRLAKYQGAAMLVEKIGYKKSFFSKEQISDENFILIIDQLNDPNNLGSLLRVSYAFGVKSILVSNKSIAEENGFMASIASGSLDKINIYKVKNLVSIISLLKKNNWWIIGLESKELKSCIDLKQQKSKFNKKALIIGSEKKGLRRLLRESCDILYRIPTKNNDLDSINVVQATSIALYELI